MLWSLRASVLLPAVGDPRGNPPKSDEGWRERRYAWDRQTIGVREREQGSVGDLGESQEQSSGDDRERRGVSLYASGEACEQSRGRGSGAETRDGDVKILGWKSEVVR
jgi:hypothetical protein